MTAATTPRIHAVALALGYCEDQSVATVLLFHEGGFDNVTDALRSLGAAFKACAKQSLRPCCAAAQKRRQRLPARYCDQCGGKLEQRQPSSDALKLFVRGFHVDVLDSHGETLDVLEDAGWSMMAPRHFPVADQGFGSLVEVCAADDVLARAADNCLDEYTLTTYVVGPDGMA